MNWMVEGWRLGGVMLLTLTLLFVVDLDTPNPFTVHVLYATVVLIATVSRYGWMPALVAGIGTVLTVAGVILGPQLPVNLPAWIVFGDRTFTIAILWTLVWFAWKRQVAEAALKRVNMYLEEAVAVRTRELADVNQTLVGEINERIHTEQALRLSEGRLAGILNIAEDAIIVTARDRSIMLFNQGAVKLFGYNPDEVLGQSIDLLLPDRFRADHASHINGFASGSDSARPMAKGRQVVGLRKDGTEFSAEASISKLTVRDKATFTVIVRDVTDRLMTERQLQSLATQLLVVQEEERRRIARELHDDINQRLALLMIEMEKFESDQTFSTGQNRDITRSLAQQLARISDDVRHMAYRFHPSILDDLGLSAALDQLTQEWSAKTGIKVVAVQEEKASLLPRNVASCLYRIAQESLRNIMKYAQADRVELELTYDGPEVTLSIYDNGVGFDHKEVQIHHSGLGLVNMRERVRSVGGHLDIQSEPGRGTHITVQIPLTGEPHEETANSLGR